MDTSMVPESFKYLMGALIVANLGTIGSIIVFGGKAVWWLSKLDARVDHAQETAVRAHKRIDSISAQKEMST